MKEEITNEEYDERINSGLNECNVCSSWQNAATEMYWKGEECLRTNLVLGNHIAVCNHCFSILEEKYMEMKKNE